MKLIYSGKTKEFTPDLEEKIVGRLAKLGKMIERRGEREAHVTHQVERHLHKIEIIVNFYDHSLVGEGADTDLANSLTQAVDKLEKQVVKLRTRWRDTHRDPKSTRESKETWDTTLSLDGKTPAPQKNGNGAKVANNRVTHPKIFRVNYDEDRKPMTLDEALLEMELGVDYVVYRDSDRSCLSVLVRRRDGHYDLIES
jgi:ribosome hibernation promoting factor